MRRSLAFLLCVLAGMLAAQSFEDEFHRGLLALSGDDLPQARQHLENASRLKPDNALVWAALAQTYLRSKETALAKEAAGRAARQAPANSPAQHALAMYYSETGDFAKAAAGEGGPNRSGRGAGVGPGPRPADLSLRAGDAEQAVAWSKTALQHGDTAQAHHLLGLAYAAANRPDESERELRPAVERDPLSEPFAFDFGQLQ